MLLAFWLVFATMLSAVATERKLSTVLSFSFLAVLALTLLNLVDIQCRSNLSPNSAPA